MPLALYGTGEHRNALPPRDFNPSWPRGMGRTMSFSSNAALREGEDGGRAPLGRWDHGQCNVYAIAGYEPLLYGLVAAVSEWPELQVVGRSTTIEGLVTDPLASKAEVLVMDVDVLGDGDHPGAFPQNLPIPSVVLLKGSRDTGWGALDAVTTLGSLHGLAIIDKDGSGERLREAIRLVQRGAFVCEMATIRTAVRRLAAMSKFAGDAPMETLSSREAEVLELVAVGLSNKEIGWRLSVSEGTVKAHVSHIMAKLRLSNRSQLVAYAMATGTVTGIARSRALPGS